MTGLKCDRECPVPSKDVGSYSRPPRRPVDAEDQQWLLAALAGQVPSIDVDGKNIAIKWKPVGPCVSASVSRREADPPRRLAAGARAAMNLEIIAVLDLDRPKSTKGGSSVHDQLAEHQTAMLAALVTARKMRPRLLVRVNKLTPARAVPVRTMRNPDFEQPSANEKEKRPLPARVANDDASFRLEILKVDATKGAMPQRSTELAIVRLTLVRPQTGGGERPLGVEVAVAYRNTAGATEAFLGLGTAGSLALARALQEAGPRCTQTTLDPAARLTCTDDRKFLTPGGVCARGPNNTVKFFETPNLENVPALLGPGAPGELERPALRSEQTDWCTSTVDMPRSFDSPRWISLGPTGTILTASDYGDDGWVRQIGSADPRAKPSPSTPPSPPPRTSATLTDAGRFAPSRGRPPPPPASSPSLRQTTTGARQPVPPPPSGYQAPTMASAAKQTNRGKTVFAKAASPKTSPARAAPTKTKTASPVKMPPARAASAAERAAGASQPESLVLDAERPGLHRTDSAGRRNIRSLDAKRIPACVQAARTSTWRVNRCRWTGALRARARDSAREQPATPSPSKKQRLAPQPTFTREQATMPKSIPQVRVTSLCQRDLLTSEYVAGGSQRRGRQASRSSR